MNPSHYFKVNSVSSPFFLPTPINNDLIHNMLRIKKATDILLAYNTYCKNTGAENKSQGGICRQTNCRYPLKAAQ